MILNKRTIKKIAMAGSMMSASLLSGMSAHAEEGPIKIGVMLPYSGVYAGPGEAATNGLKQALKEKGNKIAGRQVEFIISDTEAKPARAPELTSAMTDKDDADFIIGPVHSGVAMGMIKSIRNKDSIMIIPNAGINAATGAFCQPNVFRTSFSSWQTAYPMGKRSGKNGL